MEHLQRRCGDQKRNSANRSSAHRPVSSDQAGSEADSPSRTVGRSREEGGRGKGVQRKNRNKTCSHVGQATCHENRRDYRPKKMRTEEELSSLARINQKFWVESMVFKKKITSWPKKKRLDGLILSGNLPVTSAHWSWFC